MGTEGLENSPYLGYAVGSLVIFFLEARVPRWDPWKGACSELHRILMGVQVEDRPTCCQIHKGKLSAAPHYNCHPNHCTLYLLTRYGKADGSTDPSAAV